MKSCVRRVALLSFSRRGFATLLLGLMFLTSCKIFGQATNVTDVEATPIPGAGHDYLGTLNETVNPANGSLSLRIQVPMPQGRGLTVPFAFAYDSNGAVPAEPQPAQTAPFFLLGWSYSVPSVTAQKSVQKITYEGDPDTCMIDMGYVLTDAQGTRHAFPQMGYLVTEDPGCQLHFPNNLSGSDAWYSGQITTSGSIATGLTAQDADGTLYTFATTPAGAFDSVPTSIEDRNGNIVTYNTPGSGVLTATDTAGRTVLATNGFGASGNTVTVSGLPNPYQLTYGTTAMWNYNGAYSLVSHSNDGVGCTTPSSNSGSSTALTTITLPNGQRYGFTYDSTYGVVNEIVYPTGAWVKYTWGFNSQSEELMTLDSQSQTCYWTFGTPVITKRQVSYDGTNIAEEQDFSYSTTWLTPTSSGWSAKSTTVTTYDEVRNPSKGMSAVTSYTYSPYNTPANLFQTFGTLVPLENQTVYKDWNGSVIQTVNKTWYDQYRLESEQTVLPPPNNAASQINYSYGTMGVQTEKDEYGYDSTERKTLTTYQSFPAGPLGTTIYDRPCQNIVEDGSNNHYSETDYFYDGGATGTKCGTAGTAATTAVSGLTSHDETNYGPSSTVPRGNVTQENRLLYTTGTSPSTKFSHDETGNVLVVTDPCSNSTCSDVTGTPHTTTYQYTDSYSSGTPPGTTNAYVTKITDAKGFVTTYSYGYGDGQLTSATDENSQVTTYKYNTPPSGCSLSDGLDRLSEADFPDTGKTTYCYSDAGPNPSVTTSQLLNTSNAWKTDLSVMDGLGHVIHSELTSDPDGTDTVDTTYDGVGQVYTKSNPHRSTAWPTDGTSTYYYDALGRQVETLEQDGGILQSCYNGVASQPAVANCSSSRLGTVASGTWVDSTDENGNHWQRTSDAFGRLTEVMEPNGAAKSPAMETDYTYDLLGNLLGVIQKGNSGDAARTRSFNYDSLSRLLTSNNPETGTLSYTYDANSNVATKTDARAVATSFTYDVLNRILTKTAAGINYSYGYDTAVIQDANGKNKIVGRMASAYNNVNAGEWYAYDTMGRLDAQTTLTPTATSSAHNEIFAAYDLAGNVNSLTYPDSRTITRTYDGASRLSGVTYSAWNGTNLQTPQSYLTVSTNGYDPASHLVNATMGTSVATETASYNPRLQPAALGYSNSTQTFWNKQFAWTTNGNLQTQLDNVLGTTRQFGYDTLNRLTSAQDLAATQASTDQATDSSDASQVNLLSSTYTVGAPGMQGSAATVTENSVAAPDGSMTAGVATSTGNGYIIDYVPNPALYNVANVTGSIWLKVPTGTLSTELYALQSGDQGFATVGWANITLTTAWQKFQVTGTAQNGLTMLCLEIGGSGTFNSGSIIDFWGAGMQIGSASGSTVTNFLPYSQQWNTLSWGTLSLGQVVADNATNQLFPAPDGSYTGFQITANSGSGDTYVSDMVGTPAAYSSTQVTGSVYLRTPSGTQNINLYLQDGTGSTGTVISSPMNVQLTPTWQRFQLTATTVANIDLLYLQIGGGGSVTGGQVFDVWGAQMEAASAAGQYVPTLDTPITVSADNTNLLPSSEQVGSGGWTTSSATVVSNTTAVAAPDGTNSADAVTSTATGAYLQDAVAGPSQYDGAKVTASIYLSVPSGTPSINLHIYNQNAAGLTSIVSQSMALSSTWQRFSITGTNLNGLTKLYLQIGDSTSFPSGETVYVWGAQMVLGSSADALMDTSDTTTSVVNGQTVYLAANGMNQGYSYDGFGNIQQSGNFNFTQAYTSANQLAGWNYDASGNLLSDAYSNNYAYDSEGQNTGALLSSGGSVSYIYDASGQRIEKDYGSAVTDTIFFGGEPLARYSGGAWTDLIYGPSGLLAEVPGTQSALPTYRILDHLGTEVGTLSSAGVLLSASDYAPFGQTFQGGTPDPYQFTGKERDAESGLDNFEARYYGSSMGRFMSPDEPFIGSDPVDPQSWNLYSYVRNNPLIRVDPDGHDCIYLDGKGGGTLQRGDCTNAGGKDDDGIYVNGHVDENSFKYNANNNSSSFSYTPDGAGAGTIGVGTIQGPNLNGGFEPGSLAAGVFGAQSASTWNNAAGTVNAVAGFEMDIMAPWAGAAVNCMDGGSKVGCAANMALAVLPAGGEMRAGGKLLQASRELTAAEYISKNLKGGINAVFPGQFKGMAIKEIEAAAKNGDRAARTAMKLLTDGRFKK